MPFDTLAVSSLQKRCGLCPVAGSCLVAAAGRDDIACLSSFERTLIPLASAGKALFEAGDAAQSIYLVRAGCLKSFTVDSDGKEHVRAFHLPGDLIGLDSIGRDRYAAGVAAVTPAQVCRVAMADVRRLIAQSPSITSRLLERTSRDLDLALSLAGDFTAEQRITAFLLAMQRRLASGARTVRLPMSRRDIANYLRLATETVCRVLTRLESAGHIRSDNRSVDLLDRDALRSLAEPAMACAA